MSSQADNDVDAAEVPAADTLDHAVSGRQEQDGAGEFSEQTSVEPVVESTTLSKNQQKKLKRRQQWEDERPARKVRRKEKRVQAKERKREAIRQGDLPGDTRKQPKSRSVQVPITILIDCQFEEQMTEEEHVSMGSQLTRCYSDLRKAKYKTHLAISSFDGFLKHRFEGILNNQHRSWDVKFRQAHFVEVAKEAQEWMSGPSAGHMPSDTLPTSASEGSDKEESAPGEIVYLTSDSPHTLRELKPRSTYIIGGIVDKNRHKGICYQRACDHKVKTAKLPIGDYVKLSSRHVLTTNQVHEIMLKWLELRDWGQAFMAVIPQRKGGSLKTEVSEPGSKTLSAQAGKEKAEHSPDSSVLTREADKTTTTSAD